LEVLTRLWETVWRKRPELWPDKWILHHDNAPVNDGLRVCDFLAKKLITKMDHKPYSPDLAPLRLLALSNIKNSLKIQTLLRGFSEIRGIKDGRHVRLTTSPPYVSQLYKNVGASMSHNPK
jgi:hypothetical protein